MLLETEEQAFINGIAENPADQAAWNAYFDWLTEQGDNLRVAKAREVSHWQWKVRKRRFSKHHTTTTIYTLSIRKRNQPVAVIHADCLSAVLYRDDRGRLDHEECPTVAQAMATVYTELLIG